MRRVKTKARLPRKIHRATAERPAPPPSAPPGRRAVVGMLEWFRPGDKDRVDLVLDDLAKLGVQELRTGICWADCHTPEGDAWYSWLLPHLAQRVNVLPCVVHTPLSLSVVPKTSSPPNDPKAFGDFIDTVITRFGECFEWIELWNEPNNLREWDVTYDPYWFKFSEMIGAAAYWARHRGKKTVLGGMSPID